jgi:hypothetical protein
LVLAPARALAAPPGDAAPAAPPPAAAAVPGDAPPPTAEERAALRKKAAAAYKRGRELIQTRGACDVRGNAADTAAALDAFLDSLRLVPRPGTTFLAAVCHQALDHLEEALDLYEGYLRLSGIPDDLKTEAQKAVVALRARVGTLVIEEAERGARVFVDGRARGELPAPSPVVATAGKHLVQVFLAGFAPFEATVGVLPGEVTKVPARLTPLPRLGRLEVKERGGKTVDVVLDGTAVGHTPWEGRVGEGEHGVALRGDKELGSSPVSVTVAADKPAAVTLAAERLDAGVRVVPDPSGATVFIDDAFVGRGTFEGRLRPGEHTVKVVADGFAAATQKLTVGPGADEALRISLTREPAAPLWQRPVQLVPGRAAPPSGPPAWAWAVGGAGVVALGTAAVFGVDGLVTTSALKTVCSGNLSRCVVANQAQADTVSVVNGHKDRDLGFFLGFGAAGVAGVSVGLAQILRSPRAAAPAEGLVLVPVAGPRVGGAALGGRF